MLPINLRALFSKHILGKKKNGNNLFLFLTGIVNSSILFSWQTEYVIEFFWNIFSIYGKPHLRIKTTNRWLKTCFIVQLSMLFIFVRSSAARKPYFFNICYNSFNVLSLSCWVFFTFCRVIDLVASYTVSLRDHLRRIFIFLVNCRVYNWMGICFYLIVLHEKTWSSVKDPRIACSSFGLDHVSPTIRTF